MRGKKTPEAIEVLFPCITPRGLNPLPYRGKHLHTSWSIVTGERRKCKETAKDPVSNRALVYLLH
jgi:hypothetical protein